MKKSDEIYQSILSQLSVVPVDYLKQIDVYLRNLTKEIHRKEHNRAMILKFAGSWNDMSENDFNEFVQITKKESNELFNREIEL